MPISDDEKMFISRVSSLDDEIATLLKSFERRINSLYSLKGMTRRLSRIINELKKSAGNETERNTKKSKAIEQAEQIKKMLSLTFYYFFKELTSEKEALTKETELHNEEAAMLIEKYKTLQDIIKGMEIIGGEGKKAAEEKAREMLASANEEIRGELSEKSLNHQLDEVLERLNKVTQNERSLAGSMHEGLEEIITRIKLLKLLENTERIEELMNSIRIKQEEIDREIRTEKKFCIEPFYKLIGIKNKEFKLVKKKIESLAEKSKITREDLKKDIHSFTDSSETQRYIAFLMQAKHRKFLSEDALNFLSAAGRISSRVSEKKIIHLEAQSGLGYVDGLTGLRNRRAFDEDMAILIDSEKISPTSLIIIDIDHFKDFNDTYGHAIGDEVIKIVASAIKTAKWARTSYRWGGEEFIIAMPKKTKEEAHAAAERILSLTKQLSKDEMIRVNLRKKVEPEKEKQEITFSAGVAEFPKDASSSKELFAKADAALYHVKHNIGRGQVFSIPTTK